MEVKRGQKQSLKEAEPFLGGDIKGFSPFTLKGGGRVQIKMGEA